MKKYFLIILMIFLSISINILGGDTNRKGTSGAQELLIPVGARSIASAGAFLSNVTGLEAIYYNPAGLDLMSGSEAMFSYMNYIADISLSYFAVGTQLGEFGSLAFSYKTLGFGDIPVTTFQNPDGTGETYSPEYNVMTLSFGKKLTDRVSAGVNFKYIHEGIMNATANGMALDFGVQYKFNRNFSIGTAVKNVGTNMAFSGEDLKVKTEVPGSGYGSGNGVFAADTEPFQIPSYFELSVAYKFDVDEENFLSLASAFRNNNSFEDEMALGLEYNYTNMFFLRGGYNLLLQNASDAIYDFTLGAGINYQTKDGVSFIFDYAFRNVKEFPTANHIFTVKLGIE
jgi:hypothetical protein